MADVRLGAIDPTGDAVLIGGTSEFVAGDATETAVEAKLVQFSIGALGAALLAANLPTSSPMRIQVTTTGIALVAEATDDGASVTVAATAPGSPSDGDLWWDTTAGALKIYVGGQFREVDTTTPALTTEQVQDIVGNMIAGSGATSVAYSDGAGTITISSTDTNTQRSDEAIRTVIADFVRGGANVTVAHNDSANTLTISSTDTTIPALTTEQVQDIVGQMLRGGGATTVSYNDGAGTVTISSTDTQGGGGGGLTNEQVRDLIGVTLVGGSGITVVTDDNGNTTTISRNALTDSDIPSDIARDSEVTSYINTAITNHVGDLDHPSDAEINTLIDSRLGVSSNLERIRDVAKAMLRAGAGIGFTDDDAADEFTIYSTVTPRTDEQIMDVIGAALEGGGATTVQYLDGGDRIRVSSTDTNTQRTNADIREQIFHTLSGGTNVQVINSGDGSSRTITISATDTNTQLTAEEVQDIVGAMVRAGTGAEVEYSDAAGTITISATGGGGGGGGTSTPLLNWMLDGGDTTSAIESDGAFTANAVQWEDRTVATAGEGLTYTANAVNIGVTADASYLITFRCNANLISGDFSRVNPRLELSRDSGTTWGQAIAFGYLRDAGGHVGNDSMVAAGLIHVEDGDTLRFRISLEDTDTPSSGHYTYRFRWEDITLHIVRLPAATGGGGGTDLPDLAEGEYWRGTSSGVEAAAFPSLASNATEELFSANVDITATNTWSLVPLTLDPSAVANEDVFIFTVGDFASDPNSQQYRAFTFTGRQYKSLSASTVGSFITLAGTSSIRFTVSSNFEYFIGRDSQNRILLASSVIPLDPMPLTISRFRQVLSNARRTVRQLGTGTLTSPVVPQQSYTLGQQRHTTHEHQLLAMQAADVADSKLDNELELIAVTNLGDGAFTQRARLRDLVQPASPSITTAGRQFNMGFSQQVGTTTQSGSLWAYQRYTELFLRMTGTAGQTFRNVRLQVDRNVFATVGGSGSASISYAQPTITWTVNLYEFD